MRETNTKGVFHEYDPMQRGHHIFVTDYAVDQFYAEVLGIKGHTKILPQTLAADAASACIAEQYKHRIAADTKRLKHFRQRFGPHFTRDMMPKGEQSEH